MPPSAGYRDDSSATARPCGMKNMSAATIQRMIALGPALAAVAIHRSPRMATRLNSTTSRIPNVRLSDIVRGSVVAAPVSCAAVPAFATTVDRSVMRGSSLEEELVGIEPVPQQRELGVGRRVERVEWLAGPQRPADIVCDTGGRDSRIDRGQYQLARRVGLEHGAIGDDLDRAGTGQRRRAPRLAVVPMAG